MLTDVSCLKSYSFRKRAEQRMNQEHRKERERTGEKRDRREITGGKKNQGIEDYTGSDMREFKVKKIKIEMMKTIAEPEIFFLVTVKLRKRESKVGNWKWHALIERGEGGVWVGVHGNFCAIPGATAQSYSPSGPHLTFVDCLGWLVQRN